MTTTTELVLFGILVPFRSNPFLKDKPMKILFSSVVALLISINIAVEARAEIPDYVGEECSIPKSFSIKNATNQHYNGWLGVRTGAWGSYVPATIIISKVAKDGAVTGYYANGAFSRYDVPAGCLALEDGNAKIVENKLIIRGRATIKCGTNWHCEWLGSSRQESDFTKTSHPWGK